jgi:hypothetical protein
MRYLTGSGTVAAVVEGLNLLNKVREPSPMIYEFYSYEL